MSAKVTWLIVFVLLYWAYCIFWGVRGAQMAKTASDYFISGRKLPMWVFVLAATATSFSGWTFMGHPGLIYRDGFQYAYASFYVITIPFTGVMFLKRQWILGKRFGYVTPGEMLADYFGILKIHILVGTQNFGLDLSILHWINDVLMCVFFFVVTLEIKREFVQGELSKPKQAALPLIGAVGGMALPAIIYVIINLETSNTLRGWAIPSATDIAFSIGVLSLLGSRVPISLKVFLMSLAIIDDLGAIIIIAFFYSTDLQYMHLLLMLVSFITLVIFNKFGVKKFVPYLLIGILLWYFTHESGIHSTISGVLLAIVIPHRDHKKDFSLLLKLEHLLSPYVAFGIMPLFALANAGVSLEGISLDTLMNPVPLGILCGLFFGKQIGVFLFSYLSIKFKFAEMPTNSNWITFYGVGVLTGIGFTMSLFVGNLAFVETTQYADGVKIGVLTGSLMSTLMGYFLLLLVTTKKK